MKYYFLLSLVFLSFISFGQISEANEAARKHNNRIADALDVMRAYPTTGTNTYTISIAVGSVPYVPYSGPASYAVGDIWKVIIGTTNSSSICSLNINEDSAIPLKDSNGNNFAIGGLVAGTTYSFVYDGTNFKQFGDAGIEVIGENDLTVGSGLTLLEGTLTLGGVLTENIELTGTGDIGIFTTEGATFEFNTQKGDLSVGYASDIFVDTLGIYLSSADGVGTTYLNTSMPEGVSVGASGITKFNVNPYSAITATVDTFRINSPTSWSSFFKRQNSVEFGYYNPATAIDVGFATTGNGVIANYIQGDTIADVLINSGGTAITYENEAIFTEWNVKYNGISGDTYYNTGADGYGSFSLTPMNAYLSAEGEGGVDGETAYMNIDPDRMEFYSHINGGEGPNAGWSQLRLDGRFMDIQSGSNGVEFGYLGIDSTKVILFNDGGPTRNDAQLDVKSTTGITVKTGPVGGTTKFNINPYSNTTISTDSITLNTDDVYINPTNDLYINIPENKSLGMYSEATTGNYADWYINASNIYGLVQDDDDISYGEIGISGGYAFSSAFGPEGVSSVETRDNEVVIKSDAGTPETTVTVNSTEVTIATDSITFSADRLYIDPPDTNFFIMVPEGKEFDIYSEEDADNYGNFWVQDDNVHLLVQQPNNTYSEMGAYGTNNFLAASGPDGISTIQMYDDEITLGNDGGTPASEIEIKATTITVAPPAGGFIIFTTLPTTCVGAPSGALWNDANDIKICP
jgi:hypothetical protein